MLSIVCSSLRTSKRERDVVALIVKLQYDRKVSNYYYHFLNFLQNNTQYSQSQAKIHALNIV